MNWGDAEGVYAFNGAALEIFEEARKRGLRCVLDQTAAPWRFNTELLKAEMNRWPDWESCPADLDASGTMIGREEAEWDLADRIVCGSPFVVDGIRAVGGPVDKCRVVRYPTPASPEGAAPLPTSLRGTSDTPPRLRVLFVGTLQLRKGIQYFYEAALAHSERFEFRAVGPSTLTDAAGQLLSEHIDCVGSVPRSEVWAHYRWADVFLFPTISEGSANVCHEAMSASLPVLTTAAAGIASHPAMTLLPTASEASDILARFDDLGRSVAGAVQTRTWDSYCEDLIAAL